MLTGSPLSATYPTMPVPHGMCISFFFSISCNVDREHTSNSLDTRHLDWQPWKWCGAAAFIDVCSEPTLVDPIGDPTVRPPTAASSTGTAGCGAGASQDAIGTRSLHADDDDEDDEWRCRLR